MDITLFLLLISTIIVVFLFFIISKNNKKDQINKVFKYNLLFMFIWNIALTFQRLASGKLGINPIYFDYIAYIGICFLPVTFLLTGLVFTNTKITLNKKHLLLFIIPCISLIMLWTNNLHHLFYKVYSIQLDAVEYGPFLILHDIYTYILFFLGIFYLLRFSITNSGLFSKQSILIILGISIPLLLNIIGTLQIFPISIYWTPISFTATIFCCTLAIFKFNFLKSTPIALQKIVDRISDSYIFLNEDLEISDLNKTFLTTFKIDNRKEIRGQKFEAFLKNNNLYLNFKSISKILPTVKNSDKTVSFELKINSLEKSFNVEINSILSDGTSLGTLVLFKDITQHKKDMQTIKESQEIIMESERLASLGQLVGGIAHNLKTPIMSISGATEGLKGLVNELDSSIGNPIVNNDDYHDIAKDMYEWINKISSYTEYMSDIITAVKGQAVTMSEEENITFTIDELFKRVNILMKHELKQSVTYLNFNMNIDESTQIKGNINSLVQVINNMVSNAIQSYNGKPEQPIDLIASKKNNNIIISVRDYGCGLPDKVKDKLFKEMITTKGKNGTGLGLYMSYSNIKAHFHGDIKVWSEQGKGTRFDIILPI